eukprot:9399279-Pyramimonas_sp.AAC.1
MMPRALEYPEGDGSRGPPTIGAPVASWISLPDDSVIPRFLIQGKASAALNAREGGDGEEYGGGREGATCASHIIPVPTDAASAVWGRTLKASLRKEGPSCIYHIAYNI